MKLTDRRVKLGAPWVSVLLLLIVYMALLFHTRTLDRNYYLGVGFAVLLCYLGLRLAASSSHMTAPWYIRAILILIGLIISLEFLSITVLKLFVFPETRFLNSSSLLANMTDFTVPHERIMLITEDGVPLQAILIRSGHPSMVIVAHGGMRSKNSMGNVAIAEWLSQNYDVLTFDFRGHFESGGHWTGDGKTALDLNAAVQYARDQGYEKVGVVGRSLGAWTAIIHGARYHNVDAIVAAGSPLGQLRDIPIARMVMRWSHNTPMYLVARATRFWQYKPYIDQPETPIGVIGQVAPIPILIVGNEIDPMAGETVSDWQRLFEVANEPKALLILDGTGHIYQLHHMIRYFQAVDEWFGQYLMDSSDQNRKAVNENQNQPQKRMSYAIGVLLTRRRDSREVPAPN